MCPKDIDASAWCLEYECTIIKVLALSDNYRSIKADLYNKEETNEGPCRSKRFAFSLQSNLWYEYETNMFSSLPIHSNGLNYDFDL